VGGLTKQVNLPSKQQVLEHARNRRRSSSGKIQSYRGGDSDKILKSEVHTMNKSREIRNLPVQRQDRYDAIPEGLSDNSRVWLIEMMKEKPGNEVTFITEDGVAA